VRVCVQHHPSAVSAARRLDESDGRAIVENSDSPSSGSRSAIGSGRGAGAADAASAAASSSAVKFGAGKLPDDALLFGDIDGNPPSPNAFSAAWSDFAKRIGLPDVTFHALRHTPAGQLIDAGVDIVTQANAVLDELDASSRPSPPDHRSCPP
jgi:hypothetical protein